MKSIDVSVGNKAMMWVGTLAILGLIVAIPAFVGHQLFGTEALVLGAVIGLSAIVLGPPHTVDQLFSSGRVREISRLEAPRLHAIVGELSDRARLPRTPRVGLVTSPAPNALTIGKKSDSAIVVTSGLLRLLTERQLVGVLAHEISHVRANDTRLLMLADTARRITAVLSNFGILLLFVNVPLLMFSGYSLPLLLIALLVAAPTLSILLQLALSRRREFGADLTAAELTGDPLGLASALEVIDNPNRGLMDYFLALPRRREDPGSVFRTHPNTLERVRRLRSYARKPIRYRRIDTRSRRLIAS